MEFQPGDKVKRIGPDFQEVKQNNFYTILSCNGDNVELVGIHRSFSAQYFELDKEPKTKPIKGEKPLSLLHSFLKGE